MDVRMDGWMDGLRDGMGCMGGCVDRGFPNHDVSNAAFFGPRVGQDNLVT
jgi:hypothetical protein